MEDKIGKFFLITNEEISKVKAFSIDDFDDDNLETPDPQIKALLSTIKVPKPSEEAKQLFLNTAKKKLDEKLGKKNLLQQAKDKVDVYFIKRKHGLKLNTSEIVIGYSVITLALLLVLAPVVYYQISQTTPSISKKQQKILQNDINVQNNKSNFSENHNINDNNKLTISNNSTNNKSVSEKELKHQSSVKEAEEKNKPNLDSKKATKDLAQKENTLTIASNKSFNSTTNNGGLNSPYNPDVSGNTPFLTRGQEKRTEQNLSNIVFVSVLPLGTDNLSAELEQEFINAINNTNKWKFINAPKIQPQEPNPFELKKPRNDEQKPDAVFKIDKADGSLTFITRQGDILWQDQDYKTNYKKYNNYVISIIQLLAEGK